MNIHRNIVVEGLHQKPILLDAGYTSTNQKKPLVILAHGFKGFKDWGHFNDVMHFFINEEFVFVKFNFSHNGGTVDQPIDFPDLDAFGNNNFSIEMDDMRTVIDWCMDNTVIPDEEVDINAIYLIGHSRGGSITALTAREDDRVKKLVTWAAVAKLADRLPWELLDEWKEKGVMYIQNTRTEQEMPLYYQFAENTMQHKTRFDVLEAAQHISVPHLIVHGTADQVVKKEEATLLHHNSKHSELVWIKNGDHTFGTQHPFTDKELPLSAKNTLLHTTTFLKK